ncbi:MAG: hypothetical protein MHM6MM_004351 [Cercozoa sp. M6MM]
MLLSSDAIEALVRILNRTDAPFSEVKREFDVQFGASEEQAKSAKPEKAEKIDSHTAQRFHAAAALCVLVQDGLLPLAQRLNADYIVFSSEAQKPLGWHSFLPFLLSRVQLFDKRRLEEAKSTLSADDIAYLCEQYLMSVLLFRPQTELTSADDFVTQFNSEPACTMRTLLLKSLPDLEPMRKLCLTRQPVSLRSSALPASVIDTRHEALRPWLRSTEGDFSANNVSPEMLQIDGFSPELVRPSPPSPEVPVEWLDLSLTAPFLFDETNFD